MKWVRTRGELETMKMIKAIRLHTTRFLCGYPLHTPAHPSLGLNSLGLPRKLGCLQELAINGGVSDKRLLLTMLSISRVFVIRSVPSLDDITTSSPVKVTDEVIEEFRSVISDLNWSITKPEWKGYHLSLKQGPNGPAMLGSITDLHALNDSLVKDIITLGGPAIKERIEMLKSIPLDKWLDKFSLPNRLAVRRLSVVYAPEGKARVIAIFDYWSQTVLKPLHDSIINHLKAIKSDMTFNQTSLSGKLPDTGPYYSLDLHAATDRFPVKLQHKVLEDLIKDQEYADAWLRVMTGHKFENPWTEPVAYAVGQPMGAYSS